MGQLRDELRRAAEQRRGLQRRLRETSAQRTTISTPFSKGSDSRGLGPGGVLYMQTIDDLEAENARLEDQARDAAALYVPKIQQLEDDLSDCQRELEQALEDQRALQEDLADKAAVIRELLRR